MCIRDRVGRVAMFSTGPFAGKLAAIVEIIDHKRVRGHRERELGQGGMRKSWLWRAFG